MSFQELPDGRGKIYIPENTCAGEKKHPCPDCFACLNCADDRCRLCRRGVSKKCRARLPEDKGK